MMMRMLWGMMGMFVPFVAPSLALQRCLCVLEGGNQCAVHGFSSCA